MRKTLKGVRLRGALSLLLALCMLCALLPAAALAADDPQPTVNTGTYQYASNERTVMDGKNNEASFMWSDEWFLTDGREMDPRLATLSAIASITTAGYYSGEDETVAEFYSRRDTNVKAFLTAMEFEDYEANAFYHLNRMRNSAGCAVAHKTVTDGDKSWTLLAVLPTSAGYYDEWAGNFTVGETGLHEGFKAGSDEILRFVKQYVEENGITGDVKLWTAGHSRGSALANLIGAFFAAGGDGYFGGSVRIAPEDVYCYTYATPATVAPGVTKGQLLSVAGDRGGAYAGKDTPGSAYVYTGEDRDEDLFGGVHGGVFASVHNCRFAYDLVTLLPPQEGWGFTVFGTEFYEEISAGPDAALKAKMLEYMPRDAAVYDAYYKETVLELPVEVGGMAVASIRLPLGTNGDEAQVEWQRLDPANAAISMDAANMLFTIRVISPDGAYTMSELMDSRINGLRALMPDRATYFSRYQEPFAAIMGIYGMIWETAWEKYSEMLDASVAGPALLNYLAYVSGRMSGENPDVEAVTEVLLGLAEYLTGEPVENRDSITVDELVGKLAGVLTPMLDLEITDENGNPILSLGEMLETMLTGYAVSAMFSGDTKLYDWIQKAGEVTEAESQPIVTLLKGCTEHEGREKLYQTLVPLLPEEQQDAVFAINADGGSTHFSGDAAVRVTVQRLLAAFLVDAEGNPVTLEARADAQLQAALLALKQETLTIYESEGNGAEYVSQLAAHFDTLIAQPAQLREMATGLLCRAGAEYSFASELRGMLTFLTQARKIGFAHYNEIYIAWMQAEEELAPAAEDPNAYEPVYTEPETVTVPVSGDGNTVAVRADVSGGTAAIRKPTDGELERVIGEGVKTGEITVDVSGLGAEIRRAAIPVETMQAFADAVNDPENDASSLTVKFAFGSVTFDGAALSAIMDDAKGSDVTVGLEEVGERGLNAAQKAAVAAMNAQAVYDAYVMSGNVRIGDFKGGTAAVRVGYQLKEGQNARGLTVWYVAEDGTKTEVGITFENGFIRFDAAHFSTYVVAYDKEKAAACQKDGSCPISAFDDASPTAWYHDAVHFVLTNGVMEGPAAGKFAPGGTTSRAMAAQILWNMENRPVVNYALTYTDVAEGAWYTEAIRWATSVGILEGHGNGKFGPADNMTREQLVTTMYRYAGYKGADVSVGEDTNILSYDDAFDVSGWAMSAMQWAVGSGVITGRTASTLAPKGFCKRAEVAQILLNFDANVIRDRA